MKSFLKKIVFFTSLILISIVSPMTILSADARIDFFGARAFGNGSNSYYYIKAGDFNGDGKSDVVVSKERHILVFFGDGNGEFSLPPLTFYEFSYGLLFPAIGDFNGDGRNDIALPRANLQNQPTLAVYFGNADKTFSAPVFNNLSPLPSYPRIVDFDNDGKLDIIASASDGPTNAVAFYKGNGSGSFVLRERKNTTSSVLPYISEFNNDNFPDVFYSDSRGHWISLNDGAGNFGAPVAVNLGSETIPQGVEDFNNDGIKDIVTIDRTFLNPTVRIWKGQGNRTFTQTSTFSIPSKESVFLQEIADIDNDQKPDLILNSLNRTIISKGIGNGTFAPPMIYGEGGNGDAIVRDFNEDGWLDIAAAQPTEFSVQGSGSFAVLLNLQNGIFKSAPTLPTGAGIKDIEVLDFNGDQLKDFVVVNRGSGGGAGQVVVVTQSAGANFAEIGNENRAQLIGDSGLDPQAVVAGDFNHDNRNDIIVVGRGAFGESQNVWRLINSGNNNFNQSFFQIGTGGINDASVADFNSDGKLDLVTSAFQGVSISFGNGDGTFAAPVNYLNGSPSSRISIGDFNNDAKADIAVINDAIGKVGILINNGAGIFSNAANPSVAAGANGIAPADMNSDGKTDLIISKSRDVSVLLGNGNGTFNNEAVYQITPISTAGLAVSDFNGDKKPDVALLAGTNAISILLNNGAGGLHKETLWSGGVSLSAIVADDLNNDQKNDLIFGFTTSFDGYTKVLFNLTENQPLARKALFDYDGDGKADISVFRPSDSFWYIQNSSNNSNNFQKFGINTDLIAPADFDGDGKTDIAVYRRGAWYWINSSTNAFAAAQFGTSEDKPVPADYDGDGRADISVFRPSNGFWYRINSSNDSFAAVHFGISEDKPTSGDFDGDGKADIAVFRPSNGFWYRLNSSNDSFFAAHFGVSEDKPTPADYDGDGKTDISVYRPSQGTWYRLNSSDNSFSATRFGVSEDKPTAADFDGDGKADIAVFRPSTGFWYMLLSTQGFTAKHFGVGTDQPTPNAFIP